MVCTDAVCSNFTTQTFPSTITTTLDAIIGSDGFPVICFFDTNFKAEQFTLQVIHCSSADCTNYSITTVDQNQVGASCSIQISPNGLPIITYLNNANYDIKVAQCIDVACLKANISTLVVNGGANAVSSVIGVDGNLFLTYIQNSTETVMAAHCLDLGCSNASFSSLGWLSKSRPSVILSGDGFPLIACNSTIGHCNGIQIYLTNK